MSPATYPVALSRLSALLAAVLLVAGCTSAAPPAATTAPAPPATQAATAAKPAATTAAAPAATSAPAQAAASGASFDTQFADLIKAAKAEGQLTWYESFAEAQGKKFGAHFQERFGIQTNVVFQSAGPTQQRFESEERADKHLADIVSLADTAPTLQVMGEGLVASYDVKDKAKFPAGWVLSTNGATAYPSTRVQMAVAYNPKVVTNQADVDSLKQWSGLLDPRWANGKLGLGDITKVGSAYPTWYMWLVGQKDKYGEDFVRKLGDQKPVVYAGQTEEGQRIAAGEISAGMTVDVVAMWSYDQGAPMAWVYPAPVPVTPEYSMISKAAPHPNAAKLFMEYIHDEDGGALQWASDWEGLLGRPDLDAKISAKYTKEPWYKAPTDFYLISDWDAATKARADVLKTVTTYVK